MTIIIAALLTLICSSVVLSASFTGTMSRSGKALADCPVMFLLYPVHMQALYNSLLLKILIGACIVSAYCFFSFSNHFVVSLDIIFLLNALFLVLYHTLKMVKISPAK